jgi:Fur family ferric uptake transcriptional regulator
MPKKKQEDIYRMAYNRLCSYIDNHSLRHTSERLAILTAVCELKRFSVDDLRYSLTGVHLSRATIYNTLELMVEADVIRRVEKEFGVRAGFYELAFLTNSSVQIICEHCGRMSKVKDSTIQRMLDDKRFTNFIPDRYTIYVYGHCKVCRRKKKPYITQDSQLCT